MMLVPIFRWGASGGQLKYTAEIGCGMVSAGFGYFADCFVGENKHLAGVFNTDMV